MTPGERSYFFARLPYHLVEAGRETQLRALLMSHPWLDAKLRATDMAEVLADFERVACDPSASLVRDALRLGSHVLARDPAQLPAQLIGRLGYFEAGEDRDMEIRTLLDQARAQVTDMWLCPITPTFTPPGGGLLRTFEGHAAWVNAIALSQDGTRALSGSKDKSVKLWDTQTGDTLATFQSDSSILACALSAGHGSVICAGDQSGRVHLLRPLSPLAERMASADRLLSPLRQAIPAASAQLQHAQLAPDLGRVIAATRALLVRAREPDESRIPLHLAQAVEALLERGALETEPRLLYRAAKRAPSSPLDPIWAALRQALGSL